VNLRVVKMTLYTSSTPGFWLCGVGVELQLVVVDETQWPRHQLGSPHMLDTYPPDSPSTPPIPPTCVPPLMAAHVRDYPSRFIDVPAGAEPDLTASRIGREDCAIWHVPRFHAHALTEVGPVTVGREIFRTMQAAQRACEDDVDHWRKQCVLM
jgi:hypothetical protein